MNKNPKKNERGAGRKPTPFKAKRLQVLVPEEKHSEFKKLIQNQIKIYIDEKNTI